MENQLTVSNNFVLDSMLNPSIFDQLQRSATLYSKSGLVPKSFENNVAACFIGLQLAGAIGVNPFMLFQGLYNTNGKIGIETKVAVALANEKGVFTSPITHTFKGEGKTRSCTASATLTRSGKEVSLTVDWATVEAEGWNKKNGSKWNTMPDQMFRYRSSMWLIRTYAPEVLMGLNSLDEIEDAKIIDVTPKKSKKIDDALSEISADKTSEQPKAVVPEVIKSVKEVDRGTGALVGEPIIVAETVTPIESSASANQDLIDKIKAYNIADNVIAAYSIKAIGQNIPLEEQTKDQLEKVLATIAKIKGAK